MKKIIGGDSDNVPREAPVVVAQQKAARHWILDSGSCFDIVGRGALFVKDEGRIRTTGKFVTLQTANGVVRESRRVELPVVNINKNVVALVIDGCPNVFSLGQRCLIEGYSFRWGAGMHPVLTDPEGVETTVELDCFCLFLPSTSTSTSSENPGEGSEVEKKDEEVVPTAAQPEGDSSAEGRCTAR